MTFQKLLIAFSLLVLLFSACKTKDKFVSDVQYDGQAQVSFNNYINEDQEFGFYGVGFPIKDSFVTVTVDLKLANTTNTLDHDVKVYLAKNDAIVTDYNTNHGTNYQPVTTTSLGVKFDLSQPVVIKAGQRFASYTFQVNVVKLGLTVPSALGLVISRVEGAAVNALQNRLVVAFIARNAWDGVYELKGYHNRSPYDFPYDVEESLITVSANSVSMYFNDAGSVGHPIGIGVNQVSWYGATVAPVVVLDPTTNLVTNVYNSDPAGPVITMFTGAGSGISRFNPTTRTMYLYWNYNNNPARAFFDTLTYIRPR